MSDEYQFASGGTDFPRVTTGEYPAVIDEVVLSYSSRPETQGQPWVSVSFNLGERETTRGTREIVRLRASGKESKFAGSSAFPNPSKLCQIIRAVGVDLGSAKASDLIGKACVVTVQRAMGSDGEYNSITGFLPIGSAAAPQGVQIVGLTNRRDAQPAASNGGWGDDAGAIEPPSSAPAAAAPAVVGSGGW